MGKKLAVLALVGILIALGIISYEAGTNPVATFESDIHELAEFYGKNKVAFILPPEEPQPEKIIEKQNVVRQVELENGTIVNQTFVEEVEVPLVSSGLITGTDKQTGADAVVKRGHQFLIEGNIQLYDAFENSVAPPYRFSLTITCEFRDFCNAENTLSTNPNALTDGNGGFKYLWATNYNHDLGNYHANLLVRSVDKFNDDTGIICHDNTPDCRRLDYTNTMIIKLRE